MRAKTVFSASCAALLLLPLLVTSAPSEKLPNVLILYADDLGYGDLGCYNPKSKIPTPNLDRLASEGMRFTDGHSSSGICTPSRYALLTGRHHWRKFYGIVNAFGSSVFSPERLTLPGMFQEQGYTTGAIGKWHLGWDWDAVRKPGVPKKSNRPEDFDWSKPIPDGPLAHGFDSYFGDTVINFPPYGWIENDRMVKTPDTMMNTSKWKPIKEGRWECRPGPMCSDWDPYDNIPTTTRKGVEFITKHAGADKPFFLYFAYPSPHAPIIPNDRFDGTSGAGPYGDLVVETDDSIGQLLAALETAGVRDQTLVIFSADNGPEHYAYARDATFDHWSAEPLRGLKRDLYEGGHRVPFLVRWPGKVPVGRTSDELVSQIDLMGTLASVIGYRLPDTAAEDSHDLLPLWTGTSTTGPRETHIHNTKGHIFAIRHGDWTLIEAESGYHSKGYNPWEKKRKYPSEDRNAAQLFHISNDIGQKTNLIAEHPEKAQQLATLLKKIRAQGYSAPRLSNLPETTSDGPATAGEVRVMSWNILHKGWEKEGHASWDKRAPGVIQILRKHEPDVVGLQEESKKQIADMTKALGDYTYLDPHEKKGGGLLIRTEAWNVIESGKIPIPGKRQASWALLESTQTGGRWLFYNAHFIHRTADHSAEARMTAAKDIASHMVSNAPPGVPVVMTGDFNALHDMPSLRYLSGDAGSPVNLSNAFNLIHDAGDPRGTYRGRSRAHHCDRIDHILIHQHVTVHQVDILYYDELTGTWPSDHYPIQATLSTSLPQGRSRTTE